MRCKFFICLIVTFLSAAFGAFLKAPLAYAEDYVDYEFLSPIESLPCDRSVADEMFSRSENLLARNFPNAKTYLRWVGYSYGDYFFYVTAVDTAVDDLHFYYEILGGRCRLCFNSSSISSCGVAHGMLSPRSSGDDYIEYPSYTTSVSNEPSYYSTTIDNDVYYTLPCNVNCLNDVNSPQYVNFFGRTKISSSASGFIPIQPFEPLLFTSDSGFGTIESVSDAGLLEALYDITFTPLKIMPANAYFPLLNKELAVAPTAVADDSGYNLISLQVPQLGQYTDTVVYGKFTFKAQDVSKYSFDKLTLSFGTDKISTNDPDYTGDVTNDEFSATFAGYDLKELTTTVNSLSFFYNTIIQNYKNVELASFDYSTNTTGSYPGGDFYAIGSINMISAGAFCYNFSYSEINDAKNHRPLTPDEIDDLSDRGEEESNRKKTKLGYVPRSFSANTVDVDFGDWQPKSYDFRSASGLLSILLNDFVIDIILACVSIGIVGFILYGKQ